MAIESGSADENLEIMKAYMCKQRGIRLIKLPMKGTELDYANNLKKAFQSVHIFISSDTEEDVEIIKNTFERWRDSPGERKPIFYIHFFDVFIILSFQSITLLIDNFSFCVVAKI